MEEYEIDEFASGSEDEKRLKKAKEAAKLHSMNTDKKARVGMCSDYQLFRGKLSLYSSLGMLCEFSCVVGICK